MKAADTIRMIDHDISLVRTEIQVLQDKTRVRATAYADFRKRLDAAQLGLTEALNKLAETEKSCAKLKSSYSGLGWRLAGRLIPALTKSLKALHAAADESIKQSRRLVVARSSLTTFLHQQISREEFNREMMTKQLKGLTDALDDLQQERTMFVPDQAKTAKAPGAEEALETDLIDTEPPTPSLH